VVVPDQNAAAIKFQAGEIDALENVKPEDYATYIENAVRGDFTLHDLGPSLSTNFLWFNLNRGRSGDPKVGAAKHRWFANRAFRRAISHAIDRAAIIRGPYHGEAVENWSAPTVGARPWGEHGVIGQGYDRAEANRLLDSLGWKDRDGDGVREDDRGNPIRFTIKTNSDNLVRVATMSLIQDDLAQVGVACTPVPVEFNTLTTNLRQDFDYEAMLLGLGSASPPHPAMYANFVTSRGTTHYWHVRQERPETPAEARLDALYEQVIAAHEDSAQFAPWKEIVQVFNDECFVVWLPVQKIKVPVRNRFGNIHPTIVPHRILWNIDRVFVKDGGANA
jgi:peptide/nickel transport system substrate-binding protein